MGGLSLVSMAAKKPHWTERLGAPVKLLLTARVEADGYGSDFDGWVGDLITTAVRSPQGALLRFGKVKAKTEPQAGESDMELFNNVPGGGDD